MGTISCESLPRNIARITSNRCKSNYSSLAIPKNENKEKRYGSATINKNGLRPHVNEIAHPFYRPSMIEGFTLCYKHGKPSLLDGRPCFPVLEDGAKLIVHMRSLKFDRVQGLSKWISAYWKSLDDLTVSQVEPPKVVQNEEIVELNRPSFLNTTVLPQLEDAIELLKNEELRQKGLQEAQLALNSLIDYIMLNTKSGIYTEDIYVYLLQNCCESTFEMKVLISSIISHIESSKIDQFSVVEKLLSQTLYIIDQKLTTKFAEELQTDIVRLLEVIHHRFVGEHLRPIIDYQLFKYHIKCQNTEESFRTLDNLIRQSGCIPNDEALESYLSLLQLKFPTEDIDLSSMDPKNEPLRSKLLLNKFMRYSTLRLGYLSPLTTLLHHGPTKGVLHFLIPLCTHFNELLCLVRLALSASGPEPEPLDQRSFELILDKCISFDYMKSREKSVSVMKLYNIIVSKSNEQHEQKRLPLLLNSLAKLGAYPMLAKLIEEEKSINLSEDVALARSIVGNLAEAANWDKSDFSLGPETPLNVNLRRQFLRRYIVPVRERLELPDEYEKFVDAAMARWNPLNCM